ncbi:MAG: CBS domain-containing protein, partial [Pseudomonadota bacterium]
SAARSSSAAIPTVSARTTVREAMRLLLEKKSGCLLVVRGDTMLGIVTERDLVETASAMLG